MTARLLKEILELDENRRNAQATLDETLAQLNTYSKEIGQLYKNGEVEKANELKEKTSTLKTASQDLKEQMTDRWIEDEQISDGVYRKRL